ncbi:MAG: hypothetical protein ACKO7C_03030, partial [Bacteroidota bacterium]
MRLKFHFSYVLCIKGILIFPLMVASQCSDFYSFVKKDFEIEVTGTKWVEKKNEESVQQAEQLLKTQLRKEMAEKIVVSVKTSMKNETEEFGRQFNSYFNEHVDISSNANISFGSFSFCFDRDNKKLYGRLTIDKEALASSNYADCTSNLKLLNNEIRAVIRSSNKVDAQKYTLRLNELNTQMRTSIYLKPDLDDSEYDDLNEDCNSMIAQLKSSQTQLKYEAEMSAIRDLLRAENYNEAIINLRKLQREYKDNEKIASELEMAMADYKLKVKREVVVLESNSKYEEALTQLDAYCSLITCESDFKSLKEELKKEYFNKLALSFEDALNKEVEADVVFYKKKLDQVQDVNFKKYSELVELYLVYERSKGLNEAEKLFHQRNYLESQKILLTLEKKYGKDISDLNHLKNKVEHKIFRQEVSKEKKNRAHTLAFQLGAQLFSNSNVVDSVGRYALKSGTFTYTGGLYVKHNFEKYNRRGKGYPVSSDLIGIRLNYIDLPSTRLLPTVVDTLWSKPKEKFQVQLGVDGVAIRVFHYGFGAVYQSEMNAINWSSPSSYYGTLGFRIPFGKLSWMTDAYIQTKFKGEAQFWFSSGLYWRMDFNRKFGRRD